MATLPYTRERGDLTHRYPSPSTAVIVLAVVRPDRPERGFIHDTLGVAGHIVIAVDDAAAAVNAAFSTGPHPDVILIEADVVRSGGGVVDLIHRLRAVRPIPILVFARQSDDNEEVLCLNAGADGYLTRSLTAARLYAWLAVLLRHRDQRHGGRHDRHTFGNLRLETSNRQASVDETELRLTRTEFDLLARLMSAEGAVVERRQLLQLIWGTWQSDDHLIDVHISRLRRKLRLAGADVEVTTVRGVGFKLT
jgi:DNA-binding response OmpR family regulator